MRSALRAFPEIASRLDGEKRLLLALDFDGTLCPIDCSPDNVRPEPSVLKALGRVIAARWITPAVISGRAIADLKERIGLDIPLAGNHGLEIAGASLSFEHPEARLLRPALLDACFALRRAADGLNGAWVEDKGLTATLHFRNVGSEFHKPLQEAARSNLKRLGAFISLREGKQVLEVLPNFGWDKGEALRYLLTKKGPFDACICIGDDWTDEPMFQANIGHVNIQVGEVELPSATYGLRSPSEVCAFLMMLADIRSTADYSCGGLLDATI